VHRAVRWIPHTTRTLAFFGAAAGLLLGTAVTASASTGDISSEWPLNSAHFQADRVWAVSKGAGVTVAVVDSGVDATHPDLVGQVLPGTSLLGDGADGRTDTSSDSHGTAIAALIAGTGESDHGHGIIGLAPASKILPVRVATGSQVTASVLAQGITWAAEHGARIINVSMGSPNPDPLLRQAVDYAMSRNAIVVSSAGNDGQSGNEIMYPAGFPGVVAVAGTDQNDLFWPTSESGTDITVAAPASGIASASDNGHYVEADGTSYAAGYVSATLALICSHYPRLDAGQVIQRLISTTRHHSNDPSPQLGYGEIDPLAALTQNVDTASTANPLLALHPVPSPGIGTVWLAVISFTGVAIITLTAWAGLRHIRRAGNHKVTRTADAPRTKASASRSAGSQRPRNGQPTTGKRKPSNKPSSRSR
jgi:type VII secretion-associated serine protease mycosin